MKKAKINSVVGQVVGVKMDKTISVEVIRSVKHPRFGKFIKKKCKFKAHDEKNQAKLNDKVLITECKPISKTKYFVMSKILGKASEDIEVKENYDTSSV